MLNAEPDMRLYPMTLRSCPEPPKRPRKGRSRFQLVPFPHLFTSVKGTPVMQALSDARPAPACISRNTLQLRLEVTPNQPSACTQPCVRPTEGHQQTSPVRERDDRIPRPPPTEGPGGAVFPDFLSNPDLDGLGCAGDTLDSPPAGFRVSVVRERAAGGHPFPGLYLHGDSYLGWGGGAITPGPSTAPLGEAGAGPRQTPSPPPL